MKCHECLWDAMGNKERGVRPIPDAIAVFQGTSKCLGCLLKMSFGRGDPSQAFFWQGYLDVHGETYRNLIESLPEVHEQMLRDALEPDPEIVSVEHRVGWPGTLVVVTPLVALHGTAKAYEHISSLVEEAGLPASLLTTVTAVAPKEQR